jgi:hypothetical protein
MTIIIKKIYATQKCEDMSIIYSDLSSNAAIKQDLISRFVNKCGYQMLILEILKINRNPLICNRERPDGTMHYDVELELRGVTYDKGEIITSYLIENIISSSTKKTQIFGRSDHALIQLNYNPAIQSYKIGDTVPIVVKKIQCDIEKPMISIEAEPLLRSTIMDIDADSDETKQVFYFNNYNTFDELTLLKKEFNNLTSELLKISAGVKSKNLLEKFADLTNPYKKVTRDKLLKKGIPGFKLVSLDSIIENGIRDNGFSGEIIHPWFLGLKEINMVYYNEKLSDSFVESHRPTEIILGILNTKSKNASLLIELMTKNEDITESFLEAWSPYTKSKI